jgi:phage terminase Nu1 subunit (DNA packaging protein)
MQPKHWTINALAVELNMDRRTLAKRLPPDLAVSEKGRSKHYLMADVIRVLFDTGNIKGGSLEQERTRLTKAQADSEEMRAAERRGQLVPIEEAQLAWAKMITAARNKLLAMPNKIAPRALAARSVTDVQQIVKREVHQALTELSEQ